MKHALTERRLVAVILALYLLIGLTHSVVNPIFESSDEWSHYPFVQHVASGGGLPVQKPGSEALWRHEGSQPPLYYLVMGALTSWIDTSDLPQIMVPNPHAQTGVPLARDNKNMIIHTAREDWPWQGTVLAVHLVRILSVLMGAVTVLFTYLIARELVPDEPGVPQLATALHAFLPMFAFISASVNNDNITYMLSAIALFLILRASRRLPTWKELLLLGVVLGLAALAKLSGLVLLPLAALAIAIAHVREARADAAEGQMEPGRSVLHVLRDMAILVLPVVLIAAWWYIRNIVLYGDPTGLKVLNTFIKGRDATPWYELLLGEWESFRINFWGLFGGVNVLMKPLWIYHVLDAITLVALVGLIVWVADRLRRRTPTRWVELGLAVIYVILLTIGVARYTLSTPATQGRLIFPGLAAIMTFFALGLIGWARPAWRPFIGVPVAGLLFALSLSSPFTAIRAAYALPPTMPFQDLPQGAQNYEATFNGEIKLLGYQFGKTELKPGQELPVKLYWEAVKPPSENYSLYIKVLGRNDETLGQIDVYPGRGTLPTSLWTKGLVVEDLYYVPIKSVPLGGPVAASVLAGLYRLDGLVNLPIADPKGQVVESPLLARIKVDAPTQAKAPQVELGSEFGGAARLAGYDVSGEAMPGSIISLDLHWNVSGKFDKDYTVFVHLLDANGQPIANNDGPPLENTYPTSLWAPGDYLIDRHAIALPDDLKAGTYKAIIGLYDAASGARVPAVDGQGRAIKDAGQFIDIRVAGP